MDKNQELIEIARSLRLLADRLEALGVSEEVEIPVIPEPEPEPEPECEPEVEVVVESEPEPESEVSVVPVLTFALNDRYLFKRELFGNSTDEFNYALETLATMTTAEEVEAWLAERGIVADNNDAAKDFIAAVTAQIAKQ